MASVQLDLQSGYLLAIAAAIAPRRRKKPARRQFRPLGNGLYGNDGSAICCLHIVSGGVFPGSLVLLPLNPFFAQIGSTLRSVIAIFGLWR